MADPYPPEEHPGSPPDPSGAPVEVSLTIAARPGTIFRFFTDPARRAGLLGRCLADGGRFRDPTAAVDGPGALADHIGMAQRMGGGARLVGRGDPEPCHGVVRFGWAAVGPGEVVLATGTNVAGTDLDGRFRWVTGFWDPPAEPPEPPQRP